VSRSKDVDTRPIVGEVGASIIDGASCDSDGLLGSCGGEIASIGILITYTINITDIK
jgi:hypothetical protein